MNREFEVAEPHAEWLELCALATTGTLEPSEQKKLRLHLASCGQCKVAFSEYLAIARTAMPLVADEFAPLEEELIEVPEWNRDASKQQLFTKLDQPSHIFPVVPVEHKPSPRRSIAAMGLWAGLAACLVIAIGIGSYQLGKRSVPAVSPLSTSLLARAQTLSAQKTELDQRLSKENASFLALQKQTVQTQDAIARLEIQLRDSQSLASEESNAKAATDQKLQSTIADRNSVAAKLESTQQAYQSVQIELTKLKAQRAQDLLHYASLEVEVNDLNRQLHDAESHVKEESQYLATDRDIRELMGARQLYIADVVDVDQNGTRRKPFGRVFYTKGKSLVFYAFDLDQQPGMREAGTFQAWAQEGLDHARPVSLGIFYVDSEANRRWILKTEDPKVLAQINSVFVTVEPKGGSLKPTGKPLLYAYLKSETPNHP